MDIRKTLLVKFLRELLTVIACLSHRGRYQEEEIRMSINLPYVEGTSEKLQHILRSNKIISTFYIESTLRKLLCKPKDSVATEDKNNIVHEIDCSISEAVYFGESKRSLKSRSDKYKRSVKNFDFDKNEIVKHC